MKLSCSIALLALTVTLNSAVLLAPASAQPGASMGRMQGGGPGGPGGGQRGRGRGMGGMRRMMEQLKLTPAQQTKIKAITDSMMPQMRTIRQSTSLSEDQKRAKMTVLNNRMAAKIAPILTSAQKTKFTAMRKEREAMMKKWRAQGGPGRPSGAGAPRPRA